MKKYKYYRITVLMPESVHKQVLELAVKEKRPKSAMAAILIEDGLKLIFNEHEIQSFRPSYLKGNVQS